MTNPTITVEIDGQHVPLTDCCWIQRATCGCVVAVSTAAVAGGRVLATAEQAVQIRIARLPIVNTDLRTAIGTHDVANGPGAEDDSASEPDDVRDAREVASCAQGTGVLDFADGYARTHKALGQGLSSERWVSQVVHLEAAISAIPVYGNYEIASGIVVSHGDVTRLIFAKLRRLESGED